MPEQKATLGRIVHYGIGRNEDGSVEYRPAIVVRDWAAPSDGDGPQCVNIVVDLDGSNDKRYLNDASYRRDLFERDYPEVLAAVPGDPTLPTEMVERHNDLQRATYAGPTEAECRALRCWRTSVGFGEGVGQLRWPPRT